MRLGLLGLLVTAAAACGGDDPAGYSAEHRADFVDDCTTGAATAVACGCFYDHMAAELPFDRFVELDEQLRNPSADIPAELADFAAACAAEQPSGDGA